MENKNKMKNSIMNDTGKSIIPQTDPNISMQDNVFEEVKLPKKMTFFDCAKKCPLCGETKFESFESHLGEVHNRDTPTKILKDFKKKLEDYRNISGELYLIHFFLLSQARRIQLTNNDREKYFSITNEIEKIFNCILSTKKI